MACPANHVGGGARLVMDGDSSSDSKKPMLSNAAKKALVHITTLQKLPWASVTESSIEILSLALQDLAANKRLEKSRAAGHDARPAPLKLRPPKRKVTRPSSKRTPRTLQGESTDALYVPRPSAASAFWPFSCGLSQSPSAAPELDPPSTANVSEEESFSPSTNSPGGQLAADSTPEKSPLVESILRKGLFSPGYTKQQKSTATRKSVALADPMNHYPVHHPADFWGSQPVDLAFSRDAAMAHLLTPFQHIAQEQAVVTLPYGIMHSEGLDRLCWVGSLSGRGRGKSVAPPNIANCALLVPENGMSYCMNVDEIERDMNVAFDGMHEVLLSILPATNNSSVRILPVVLPIGPASIGARQVPVLAPLPEASCYVDGLISRLLTRKEATISPSALTHSTGRFGRIQRALKTGSGAEHQIRRFDMIASLSRVVELIQNVCKYAEPSDILNLYCTSRDFHSTFQAYSQSLTLAWIKSTADERAAQIFDHSLYWWLFRVDPAERVEEKELFLKRPLEFRQYEPAKNGHAHMCIVPTLKWFLMVMERWTKVKDILAHMSRQGLRSPRHTDLALLKLWMLMETRSSTTRSSLVARDAAIFQDRDLYLIHGWIIKLHMLFNDPRISTRAHNLVRVLMGQRGLGPLWSMLFGHDYRTAPSLLRLYLTWFLPCKVNIPPSLCLGVEPLYFSKLRYEEPLTSHDWKPLNSADLFILAECRKRQLHVEDHIVHQMRWGFVDEWSGCNLFPSEDEIRMENNAYKNRRIDTSLEYKAYHVRRADWRHLSHDERWKIYTFDDEYKRRIARWDLSDTADRPGSEAAAPAMYNDAFKLPSDCEEEIDKRERRFARRNRRFERKLKNYQDRGEPLSSQANKQEDRLGSVATNGGNKGEDVYGDYYSYYNTHMDIDQGEPGCVDADINHYNDEDTRSVSSELSDLEDVPTLWRPDGRDNRYPWGGPTHSEMDQDLYMYETMTKHYPPPFGRIANNKTAVATVNGSGRDHSDTPHPADQLQEFYQPFAFPPILGRKFVPEKPPPSYPGRSRTAEGGGQIRPYSLPPPGSPIGSFIYSIYAAAAAANPEKVGTIEEFFSPGGGYQQQKRENHIRTAPPQNATTNNNNTVPVPVPMPMPYYIPQGNFTQYPEDDEQEDGRRDQKRDRGGREYLRSSRNYHHHHHHRPHLRPLNPPIWPWDVVGQNGVQQDLPFVEESHGTAGGEAAAAATGFISLPPSLPTLKKFVEKSMDIKEEEEEEDEDEDYDDDDDDDSDEDEDEDEDESYSETDTSDDDDEDVSGNGHIKIRRRRRRKDGKRYPYPRDIWFSGPYEHRPHEGEGEGVGEWPADPEKTMSEISTAGRRKWVLPGRRRRRRGENGWMDGLKEGRKE